ncbi:MAG: TetR/AcrR family transcriptional regulator [Actinomycetota bacterium]
MLYATEALLLKTNDADSVSIRAVAEAVGVTSPSIYMHFARKEELLLEVCERQFGELDRVMEAAAGGIDDPVEVVKAMGRAYIRFGLERPEQYRFLFMERTPEWAIDHMERISEVSGFGRVVSAVQRCIDEGWFKQDDPFLVACALWTGVHGVTSLLISKPAFPWPDRDKLIDFCISTTCVTLAN